MVWDHFWTTFWTTFGSLLDPFFSKNPPESHLTCFGPPPKSDPLFDQFWTLFWSVLDPKNTDFTCFYDIFGPPGVSAWPLFEHLLNHLLDLPEKREPNHYWKLSVSDRFWPGPIKKGSRKWSGPLESGIPTIPGPPKIINFGPFLDHFWAIFWPLFDPLFWQKWAQWYEGPL